MSKRFTTTLLAAVLLIEGGCYQDDSTASIGPASVRPVARVLLTDAPFPYDSVASVNVYVVSVAASTDPDTTGDGGWETIAQPGRVFDLLSLQQGTTALLGEGQLSGKLYRAIRVIIDADGSSVLWKNGSAARVNWPFPGSGRIALHAQVEEPLALITDASQVEIVIDWDVGRSFLYDYDGTGAFTLIPWLRAMHSAFTGTLAGTVTSDYTGTTQPIANANVSVYAGDPNRASTWYLVATGRSNAAGFYRVAFLGTGSYIVRVEQPDYPRLAATITPAVEIVAGDTTNLAVSLTEAGAGGAFLRITAPTTSVGVGGRITLFAAVGGANGDPVPNPSVSWMSSDPAVAEVLGIGDTASVTGRQPGFATITATSDTLHDTITIQVTGTPASVATVTLQPASASLLVGDTASFTVMLRDAGGNVLTGRPVSWFSTDSAFVIEASYGTAVVGRGRRVGSALLQATSEGKTGQATITVH